jgi:hypothetical protein
MRIAGFAGWCTIAALLPGLGGCSHHPSRASVIRAGREILAEEPLCVLMAPALRKRVGEHHFVEAKNRAAIEPFIQAGLLAFVDRPAGLPDDPQRLWYDVTPYGGQWSASCRVSRYSYPVEFGWGFRVGTPKIVKTYPLTILTRGECETSAGVMVEYRMKLEPWFVPSRFETNFAAGGAMHYFDVAQNVGRAHVRYTSGDGRHWLRDRITYGHQNTFICKKV